jgi:hypothetical protein
MDKRTDLLYITLALAVIGGVLYFLATTFYFFWIFWWYDVVVHFLVGMTGGFSLYWGFYYSGLIFRGPFKRKVVSVGLVFICVMAVAVGWEIFEYQNGITDSSEGYVLDTINDLILGGAGAILAGLFASRKRNNG